VQNHNKYFFRDAEQKRWKNTVTHVFLVVKTLKAGKAAGCDEI